MRLFNGIKIINVHLNVQIMATKFNERKTLNSIGNKLNYKPAKAGLPSGNLANFATLTGCTLAGNLLPLFFFWFPYTCSGFTDQQNFKKI